MKKPMAVLLTAAFLSAVSLIAWQESSPMFNGKDLSGWHVEGGALESWSLHDSILSCIAPGGGFLTTDSLYADFELTLEWRIEADGNSGVGLRFPSNSHVSEAGMEIQILDDGAEIHKSIKPAQHTGSIYLQVPARQGAAKPVGEWNRYTITCQGSLVVVVLNGEEVVRADLDKETTGHEGLTPLSERPRSGHIGFQSHGTRVDFRNVSLKKL
jgi:hypothetical protein